MSWSSNRDGALGNGGSFSKKLADGVHTITASATDSGGRTGSSSVVITVGCAPTQVTVTSVTYSLSKNKRDLSRDRDTAKQLQQAGGWSNREYVSDECDARTDLDRHRHDRSNRRGNVLTAECALRHVPDECYGCDFEWLDLERTNAKQLLQEITPRPAVIDPERQFRRSNRQKAAGRSWSERRIERSEAWCRLWPGALNSDDVINLHGIAGPSETHQTVRAVSSRQPSSQRRSSSRPLHRYRRTHADWSTRPW